jgi:hypothetical protein
MPMLVGTQVVGLQHAPPSKVAFADSLNTMMQALRSIGRKNVGDDVVKQIARAVPRKTKDDFIRLSPVAPDWTRPIMKRIASE